MVYTRQASTFLHSCRKSIAAPQLIVADALVDAELRGGLGVADLVIDGESSESSTRPRRSSWKPIRNALMPTGILFVPIRKFYADGTTD